MTNGLITVTVLNELDAQKSTKAQSFNDGGAKLRGRVSERESFL